jgi:hypothetical protein
MSKSNLQFLFVLFIGLIAVAGAWQFAGAQGEKVRETLKFEYKILSGTSASGAELNILGKDGWELVAVEPSRQGVATQLYFKRAR